MTPNQTTNPPIAEISKRMRESAPVFIVGAPRSGTTILARAMLMQSAFRSTRKRGRLVPSETKVFSLPRQFATSAGDSKATGFVDFFGKDQQALRDFEALTAEFWSRGVMSPVFVGMVTLARQVGFGRALAWELGRFSTLARAYFFFAMRARRVDRLLEKSPDHIRCLPEMCQTFPHAQFLFIHRHPVDTFASYAKRLARARSLHRDEGDLRWLEISPQEFIGGWNARMSTALTASQANPERFLLIRYEELTAAPARCLEQVMTFVGEPFDAQALPEDGPTSWRDDPLVHQSIRPNQSDWETVIGRAAAVIIEAGTAALCKQLNYSSKTGAY